MSSSRPLPFNFPKELASAAFFLGEEAAWPPDLAASAVEWFGSHGYAVLGTELWVVQGDGTMSLYGNTVDKEVHEDWRSFALRSALATRTYLESFDTSEVVEQGKLYFNISWVSESLFSQLKAL